LSIGSCDPLSIRYLALVKELADFLDAPFVTDHLCWTGVARQNLHDLLPLPYTQEALDHVASRVMQTMDFLGRPIALENPSTYLRFNYSPIPENEFLIQLHQRTGCGILLDLNNLYINAYHHGFDAKDYIRSLPRTSVFQYHLAGHTHKGTHILDTHIGPVPDDILVLFKFAVTQLGSKSTLLEWDDKIPEFSVLEEECARSKRIISRPKRIASDAGISLS
jgi:uncharacterized protein (UPF0276 family)